MFHLIADLTSVPSEALCDLVLVFARLQRHQPALLQRIIQQAREPLAIMGTIIAMMGLVLLLATW